ncbi:MAG: hypothetical protein WCK39_08135 [Methanomassiliicoccales archaeon]
MPSLVLQTGPRTGIKLCSLNGPVPELMRAINERVIDDDNIQQVVSILAHENGHGRPSTPSCTARDFMTAWKGYMGLITVGE